MRIIKVANVKTGGLFNKKREEKADPRDILVDHFKTHVKPKVLEELKRAKDLDNYNPNISDYKFLIGTMKGSFRSMFNKYVQLNSRNPNLKEQSMVQEILINDSERSLSDFQGGLAQLRDMALTSRDEFLKDPDSKGGYLLASREYTNALNRLVILLFEFSENYFKLLGKTDVFERERGKQLPR